MGKPKISVRQPPSAAEIDEFVSGRAADANAQPPAASPQRPDTEKPAQEPARGIVTRTDGKQYRRFTVYLPRKLGDLLERRAFEQRRELSAVLAELIGDALK